MSESREHRDLQIFAERIRLEALRAVAAVGMGHVGGMMSIAEALAVLYGDAMKVDPADPHWEGRDWLVLSKGHAGPALYAALAIKGFFPLEWLETLNRTGTRLPSHCDRNRTPGVDMTTGSLGQGMSLAAGIALAMKIDARPNRTYLILGDGECQEGQVWEGALFAAHHALGGLTALVDMNRKQLDGYTRDVCDLGSIGAKFEAFGWRSREVDGHDVSAIRGAIREAWREPERPTALILHTEKGRGCSFAEGVLYNHHMTCGPEQSREAAACIEERLAALAAGAAGDRTED